MLAGCQKILVHYTKGFSVTLMISDKKNLKIAAVVCVSLSAFLAVYRVFLLCYHIDPANGLYTDAKSGSIRIVVCTVSYCACNVLVCEKI